jgi:transcription elongation factor Elf1
VILTNPVHERLFGEEQNLEFVFQCPHCNQSADAKIKIDMGTSQIHLPHVECPACGAVWKLSYRTESYEEDMHSDDFYASWRVELEETRREVVKGPPSKVNRMDLLMGDPE